MVGEEPADRFGPRGELPHRGATGRAERTGGGPIEDHDQEVTTPLQFTPLDPHSVSHGGTVWVNEGSLEQEEDGQALILPVHLIPGGARQLIEPVGPTELSDLVDDFIWQSR